MGAVYEALDLRLDTTVALKETLFVDDRLRKQFEREARLLARLHHPALPRVSDHFSELEGQFLVMQFIKGEDLYEKIEHRWGPFPPDQVTSWADQLLDALDYLHTQDPQIVHRDIKPQNLKVTPRGQIILLDFGLAKGQGSEVSRVTTSANIFGYTPNYAPLEQIQGLGTFRDGTQLITSPDGTRIVITPDGKRRVFRRGQKMDREIPEPSPEKSRP